FVPRLAEVHATADVGDGVHEAPVEQAQPIRTESWIDTNAVGSVAIEQHWRMPVPRKTFFVHQRDRDFDAVRRGRVNPLGLVQLRIVAAQHRLLLLQLALAGFHVVVVDRSGCYERGVVETQQWGVKFGVGAEFGSIDWLRKLDRVLGPGAQVANANLRQAAMALFGYQVILKCSDALDRNALATRNNFLPIGLPGIRYRRFDHPEAFGAIVGADEK